jgi:serine/threonine-protein kinase
MPTSTDKPPEIEGLEIGDRLGAGGMSMLWKAQQKSLNRTVVVKVLSTDLSRGLEDIKQFMFEAQVAANLKHPGIVQVYDFGQSKSDGRYYFIMEYISGYSVGDWVRRKGFLDEENALLVVQSVAEALFYAWNKGKIVHCDIKPDNIMIDGDGTVKLTDMGLAHAVGNVQNMRNEAGDVMVMGTPNYMAPEQVRGEPTLDCRTDIYALGATLYHLVTGVLPFEEFEGSKAMEEQVRGFLQDPRQINLKVRYPVARLIEKMMMKDPAKRQKDWQEVLNDLACVHKGKLPLGDLPGPLESTVVIDHLKEQARLAGLLPVEKIETPVPGDKVSIKVSLPNPMTPAPSPSPVPAAKPSPRPSPAPIQVPPAPPPPAQPQPQSAAAAPAPVPAPAPKLRMAVPAPTAAPQPAASPPPAARVEDPAKPGCVRGFVTGVGKLLRTMISMGMLILVVYVTYNQFIRKPRKDVITPVREWLIAQWERGLEWWAQWRGGGGQEDEESGDETVPAPREVPAPVPEPEPAPVAEPSADLPAVAPVDIEATPEFQKLLSQCEARRPKMNEKITLKLRNRPEAIEGVVTDVTDKSVTLKVKEGYVDCPFNILEERDRLRFFPRELARKIYQQQTGGSRP